MKFLGIAVGLGLFVITGMGFWFAPLAREQWIIISFLSFGGIFIFDNDRQIVRNIANIFLFLIAYGILIKSILEPEPELFWRDCAGIVFLVALSFEQNGRSWFGTGGLKSSVGPAVLFFIFVLASSLPILTPEQSFTCTVCGLLVFCFLECFYILRSRAEAYAGSFMSAIRLASCGVISIYYCTTFLPGISSSKPFTYFQLVFPVLGLLVALFGALFEEIKRRYILFCAGWSLFVFWAALSNEPFKVYAGIGGMIAGSWAVMMTNRPRAVSFDSREIFLKLSAWGIPGSILFSFIVLTLLNSADELSREGSVIWLFSFFVYWARLSRVKWELPDSDLRIMPVLWTWRNSLALSVTIAGGGLLAGAKSFPFINGAASLQEFSHWLGLFK